jgi:thiol-disulfide isomerase/thioredoxin
MKSKKAIFYLLLLLTFLNEVKGQQALNWSRISNISLINLSSKKESIKASDLTVLVMLSPECPLSKNYIPVLNQLSADHKYVRFYGIFPGASYPITELDQFKKDFKVQFTLLVDKQKKLTRLLKANTTPECIVLDKNGMILYRGLIDNWPVSLGTQRKVITEKYLANALYDFQYNQPINPKNTTPIGCLINDQ